MKKLVFFSVFKKNNIFLKIYISIYSLYSLHLYVNICSLLLLLIIINCFIIKISFIINS